MMTNITEDENIKDTQYKWDGKTITKIKKNIMADKYTVWVGGVEINDNLMPKEEAIELANSYRKRGYRDVHIEKYYVFHSQLKDGKKFINEIKKQQNNE